MKRLLHCLIAVQIAGSQVIDGDSIRNVDIPLGLGTTATRHLRLHGINAPEIRTEKGPRAKARLAELVELCSDLYVKLHGADAFGRALVDLYCGKISINDKMIKDGYAVPYRRKNGSRNE